MNKELFKTSAGLYVPLADATNEAGGAAYKLTAEQALAQYAATGCLNGTYYSTAGDQLATVLALAKECSTAFIAQTAVYTRKQSFMKDVPALLCAVLATRGQEGIDALDAIFAKVIDNDKMLRNFVQTIRSGVVGRKSLGTALKWLVRAWLDKATDERIFTCVGQSPSMADIVKMVHPKPATKSREALYGYMLGKKYNAEALPSLVAKFEAFKADPNQVDVPDVPFQMLSALPLTSATWCKVAVNGGWHMVRMNLNTFARHGVFQGKEVTEIIADRLRDPEAIANSRVFPYQIMSAYTACSPDVPEKVRDALHDAMELACNNVPVLPGKVFVCPDVSGSMSSPITGHRKGSTSTTRCIDVAALFASAVLRRNPDAEVLPFAEAVKLPKDARITARDTVITNAQKLAALGGGGTNCSAPLAALNHPKVEASGDTVIYVSDNESWIDTKRGGFYRDGTETMKQWAIYKLRNPRAKLVCIDLTPNQTAQNSPRADILNIGGFSDRVFDVVAAFVKGDGGEDYWVNRIKEIQV
jgi:60 kDa SS-A/Ro ribonucleoprotein